MRTITKSGVFTAVLCVVLGTGAGVLLRVHEQNARLSPVALIDCLATSTDPTFASRCLHDTVERLLTVYTTKELMDYTAASTTPFLIAAQCHPIGHIIGELTYEKSGSIEGALAQCNAACRSACTHGAVGAGVLAEMGQEYPDEDIAHADKDQLITLAIPYCKQSDSICHGIGHVAYIATQDDVQALSVCDSGAVGPRRESCYQGVFMERGGSFFDVLFPTATPGVPVVNDDYTYPCNAVAAQYRHACFLFLNEFQAPLFKEANIVTPAAKLQKAEQVCEALAQPDRSYCFEGIGTEGSTFGFVGIRFADVQPLCDHFATEDDRDACVLGVIPRFFYAEHQKLYPYCEDIPEESRRTLCYNAAFQWDEVRYGMSTAHDECGLLQSCLTRYATYKKIRTQLPDYRYGLFGVPHLL